MSFNWHRFWQVFQGCSLNWQHFGAHCANASATASASACQTVVPHAAATDNNQYIHIIKLSIKMQCTQYATTATATHRCGKLQWQHHGQGRVVRGGSLQKFSHKFCLCWQRFTFVCSILIHMANLRVTIARNACGACERGYAKSLNTLECVQH